MDKHTPGRDYESGRTRSDLRAERDRLVAENKKLILLLRLIVNDLPQRRDWLDPDIENAAREILAKHKEQ